MPNSKQIVYLSQTQYAELIANGTITVDGVTVTYDENDIYVTPQAEPVTDVRVAGTSIAANGVANIPIATTSILGVVKGYGSGGIRVFGDGRLAINSADDSAIKGAGSSTLPIVPSRQHISVFYGLARAAGAAMNALPNTTVGVYPDAQKAAIQSMLGVSDLIATAEPTLVASKAYAIGDVFTANGKLYKATAAIAANDTIVLQNEGETISGANAIETKVGEGFPHDVQVNGTSVVTDRVANIPVASTDADGYGVIRVGASATGLQKDPSGYLKTYCAALSTIKSATDYYQPIVPIHQHESVFYGLAKAAGDATQAASDNAVGTYTNEAKAAIKSMIGINVEDVQVNGTSVVSDGIAEIPRLGASGSGNYGVCRVNQSFGITQNGDSGYLILSQINDATVKAGDNQYIALTPRYQHKAVFYGLAKASGDTTQSASSNAIGTYTDSAKASIKQMLGIVDGSTGTVDISGAAPSITAVENTRYVCGEVTSLSFTPAASGICIVRFTSGSTATLLTVPNTVKFPEWFDSTSLETNTIYEICITDGVYGAVMLWAQ